MGDGGHHGTETGSILSSPRVNRERRSALLDGAAEPDVRPGDCLGRYTVGALIGAGGMGRVFAAVDSELGRAVALKLVLPDYCDATAHAHARLLREAKALARLHHPNVVTVFEVGTHQDRKRGGS